MYCVLLDVYQKWYILCLKDRQLDQGLSFWAAHIGGVRHALKHLHTFLCKHLNWHCIDSHYFPWMCHCHISQIWSHLHSGSTHTAPILWLLLLMFNEWVLPLKCNNLLRYDKTWVFTRMYTQHKHHELIIQHQHKKRQDSHCQTDIFIHFNDLMIK